MTVQASMRALKTDALVERARQVCKRTHAAAADVTADEIAVAQVEAAELLRRLRHPVAVLVDRLRVFVGASAAVATMVFAVACLLRLSDLLFCEGKAFEGIDWRFVVALALSVAVDHLAMLFGRLRDEGIELTRHLGQALQPLTERPHACEQALQLVNQVEGARQLRDAVVARGEVLRQFHLSAMVNLADAQGAATAQERRAQVCRELHGLQPDAALGSA